MGIVISWSGALNEILSSVVIRNSRVALGYGCLSLREFTVQIAVAFVLVVAALFAVRYEIQKHPQPGSRASR